MALFRTKTQKKIYKKTPHQELYGELGIPGKNNNGIGVLVVHGGSWYKRSGDMRPLCRYLTKKGFTTFNITYRLAPQDLFPKAVEDVEDAIHWFSQEAKKLNLKHIAGWGYSAGANLILLAGFKTRNELSAIVAGGTPSDLTVWPYSPYVKRFIGHNMEDRLDLWKAASPAHVIPSHPVPPVFLYHGKWDILVTKKQMDLMQKALEKEKRKVESFSLDYHGHIAAYFFGKPAIKRGIEFIQENLKN